MIIIMKTSADTAQIDSVTQKIEELGYQSHVIHGENRTVIGAVGDKDKERLKGLVTFEGVDKVVPVMAPYKLAARSSKEEDTVIRVGDVQIGGGTFVVVAGPCSVETEPQILASAHAVKKAGGHLLRGGAYKPRTSPYSFQGLEEDGLKLLQKAKKETGLPIVTELLAASTTPWANTSHLIIPPKILIKMPLTFLSAKISLKAAVTFSFDAPPPTSKKFAGSEPYNLIISIVAIAKPAPFTMQPILPSKAT